MTAEERAKRVSKVRIQKGTMTRVAVSSMSSLKKSVVDGKWYLTTKEPVIGTSTSYSFQTMKMARSFMERHELIGEKENLINEERLLEGEKNA